MAWWYNDDFPEMAYMPVIVQLLTTCLPLSASEQPEVTSLYLPSKLLALQLLQCRPGLVDLKKQFHEAQCSLSIEHLHDQLFIKTWFLVHKGLHLCHQAANTQAHVLLDQNKRKIQLHAVKYRDVRVALLRFHGDNMSSFEWEELKQEDIQCMEDPDALEKHAMNATPGESKHKLSWIWMAVAQGTEGNARMYDSKWVYFIFSLVTN